MARGKYIPEFDRITAIALQKQGKSTREIARKIGCCPKSISNILQRYKTTGQVQDRFRSGRPKISSARDDRALILLTRKNRRSSSSLLSTQWKLSNGKTASSRTVRRVLKSNNYEWKAAAKKLRQQRSNKSSIRIL